MPFLSARSWESGFGSEPSTRLAPASTSMAAIAEIVSDYPDIRDLYLAAETDLGAVLAGALPP